MEPENIPVDADQLALELRHILSPISKTHRHFLAAFETWFRGALDRYARAVKAEMPPPEKPDLPTIN